MLIVLSLLKGQFLDALDPSVLQNALMRRCERTDSTHNKGSTPSLAPAAEGFAMEPMEHLSTDTIERQVDRVNDINSGLFSRQDETIFFADAFDPSLGLWLNESFMNTQGPEALVGGAQDFPSSRPQYLMSTPNPRIPFGFFPNVASSQGVVKTKHYAISVPAAIIDETSVPLQSIF
jgi:hypothetical protein